MIVENFIKTAVSYIFTDITEKVILRKILIVSFSNSFGLTSGFSTVFGHHDWKMITAASGIHFWGAAFFRNIGCDMI